MPRVIVWALPSLANWIEYHRHEIDECRQRSLLCLNLWCSQTHSSVWCNLLLYNGIIHKHFWDSTSSGSFQKWAFSSTRTQLDLRHKRYPKYCECWQSGCILSSIVEWNLHGFESNIVALHAFALSEFSIRNMNSAYCITASQIYIWYKFHSVKAWAHQSRSHNCFHHLIRNLHYNVANLVYFLL